MGDLKTGRGRVSADHNDQLLTYLIGALRRITFTPREIVLAVIQPVHYGAMANIWRTDMVTAEQFQRFLAERAALTDVDTPPEPSDEACRWCPARPICPAHTDL